MNFVDAFLDYTSEAESPTSYFRWAAYTTIAATLRRNVWIDLGYNKLYPNMYTLILSRRSSLVKKSTPLKTSLRLLQLVDNTKIVSGRATIAGIIGILTGGKTTKQNETITGGTAILYSEEISALLIEDDYATDTLTDWYDGYEEWSSNLSNSSTGSVVIHDLCLSILASSNEELIRTVFNSRATQGGLLARTFLIVEAKKRHKNSLMYLKMQTQQDGPLIKRLYDISKIKGPMILEENARKFYDQWYNEFEPLDENTSNTGIEGRIHTHILKLATVKSVAERNDRIITLQHMEEAMEECIDLLPNYKIFAGGSEGPVDKVGRKILELLLDQPDYTVPKTKIMWHIWGAGLEVVNASIEALSEANCIVGVTKDGQFCLKLTPMFIEKITKKVTQD